MLIAAVACLAAPAARADTADGRYIVTFAAGTSESDQASAIADAGATDVSEIAPLRLHSVSVPTGAEQAVVDALKADARVTAVDQDRTRDVSAVPSDPDYASQWSLSKIGWDNVFGSVAPTGTAKVAILDTGIDSWHPDLSGNTAPGTSIIDPFSDGATDPNGHGTEMAGIVAASADNGIGIAGVGYAGVSVMPVQVLDAQGVGQDSDIIQGIVWAADHGADVILMSFSNPGFSQGLQDAVDYAWSKGAVIVAATGNDGVTTPTFPAGDRGVVGVANTDQNDALNASSNSGDDVFMAAPGTDVYTTSPGGYTTITGTSASAAAVAGAAALLKADSPDASNGVIVGRLARNADAAATTIGNGRLNLERAISDSSSTPVEPAGATPVGDGGPLVGPYTSAAVGITVTPTTVAAGTPQTITVSGGGNWTSNRAVTIKDDGVVQTTTPNPCVTPSNGGWSCTYTITPAQKTHTVTAQTSSDGPASDTYVAFGAATELAFTTQPSATSGVNTAFATQPRLTLRDSDGNVVTNDTRPVTLAITSGTGTAGANLSCTTNPVTPVNGVAIFSGCKVDTPGAGYTLTAQNATLTSTASNPFSIAQPAASLPLRSGSTTGIRGATTPLTISKSFGTTMSTLSPNNGNSYDYDFYSAPLTAPAVLAATDTGLAQVDVKNNNPSGTGNNVMFRCAATVYDYDPAVGGSGTTILSTGTSGSTTANANGGVGACSTPTPALGASGYTVPAGHLLRANVVVTYLGGGTGTGGTAGNTQLLYNASSGASGDTRIVLPNNTNTTNWQFGAFTQGPNITLGAGVAMGGNAMTSGNKVTVSYTRNGVAKTADVYDGTSMSDFVDAGSTASFSATSSNSGTSERWQANSAGTAPTHTVSSTGTSGVLTTYAPSVTKTYYDQLKLTVSSAHGTSDSTGTAFGTTVSSAGISAFFDRGSTANAKLADTSVTELGTTYAFTGWSGDASGANAASGNITMDAAKTATATWDAVPTATASLSSDSPKTNDTLTATATTADADALDTVTLTYVWKVNGTVKKTTSNTSSLTDTFDLSAAGNGDRGDTITVEITPKDSQNVSGSLASDSATVVNSAPVATDPVFDPVSPRTKDSLSASTTTSDVDGDQVAVDWTWKVKRGATTCVVKTDASAAAVAGERSSSLDLDAVYHPSDADCGGTAIDPFNPSKGDTVTVEAAPSDADDSGTAKSSHVGVANTLPVVDSAALDATSPKVTDSVSVSVTSSDADGDTVNYDYQWQKQPAGGTGWDDIAGATSDTLAVSGHAVKGDKLRVQVTPKDGESSGSAVSSDVATVANSAPTATLVGTTSADEGQTKTYTFTTSDADGDTVGFAAGYPNCGTGGTLSGQPDIADGSFDCSFPDGPATPTVALKVVDSAGAPSSEQTKEVIVANVAPSTPSLVSPAVDAKTSDNTPTFDWSDSNDPGVDDVISYALQAVKGTCDFSGELAVDESDLAASTSTPSSGLTDGSYCWRVSASDSDTGVSDFSSTRSFTIDTAPPASHASSPQYNNGSSLPVDYTASDESTGLAKVELWAKGPGEDSYTKVDTMTDGATSGSFSYSPSADGSYRFYTIAEDGAGNREAVPTGADSVTVVEDSTTLEDTVPPATTDDGDSAWHDSAQTLTLSPSDPGAGDTPPTGSGVAHTYYTIDSGSQQEGTSVQVAGDGTHTVEYWSVDNATNEESPHNSATVLIDTGAPTPTITAPSAGADLNTPTPSLSGAAGDLSEDSSHSADGDEITVNLWSGASATGNPDRTLTVTRSGGSWSLQSSDWDSGVPSKAPLTDGTWTARAEQSDGAANTGESDTRTFKVDTVAPDITSVSDSPDATNSSSTIAYSLSENAKVTVQVRDAGSQLVRTVASDASRSSGANSETWDLKDSDGVQVPDGTYTYTVDARDGAGNDATQQSGTVKIDTAAPAPTITVPAGGAELNSSTPALSGAAGDQSADSSHAVDGAQITVKIWSGGSVAGDPDRTLMVTRLGGGWALQNGDWDSGVASKAPLTSGTWTARAEQSDGAGNTGNSSTRTFKVDTVAPAPTLTSPVPNTSVSTGTPTFIGNGGTQATSASASADSSSLTVKVYSGSTILGGTLVRTLTTTLDGAGGYSVPASPALASGVYTAQSEQTDAAGNIGFSASTTFTVNALNYNFTGFFQPVTRYDSPTPVFNQLNAGAAVPVKFSLGGNKGLDIFESNYPASQVIPCGSFAQVDAVEQTVPAGQSSLSYDSGSGQYTYVWKTLKTYSAAEGPCRQLVVKFKDGTYQRANFKFTK